MRTTTTTNASDDPVVIETAASSVAVESLPRLMDAEPVWIEDASVFPLATLDEQLQLRRRSVARAFAFQQTTTTTTAADNDGTQKWHCNDGWYY